MIQPLARIIFCHQGSLHLAISGTQRMALNVNDNKCILFDTICFKDLFRILSQHLAGK